MILALLAAPLKVTAAEQNGESSDKQQNETTEQKTEETEETAPEMTTDLGLASPSVLLMEAQTGTVLYEKNASEQRSPASITKIMTLLLIFEELEKGMLQRRVRTPEVWAGPRFFWKRAKSRPLRR